MTTDEMSEPTTPPDSMAAALVDAKRAEEVQADVVEAARLDMLSVARIGRDELAVLAVFLAAHVRALAAEVEQLREYERASGNLVAMAARKLDIAEKEVAALRARVAALEAAAKPLADEYEKFRRAYVKEYEREPPPGAESCVFSATSLLTPCRRLAALLAPEAT